MRSRSVGAQRSVVLLLLLALALERPATAQEPGSDPSERDRLAAAIEGLEPRYRDWLRSVAGLITQAEVDYFLELREDYKRDQFIEAFWRPRDPDPRTPTNELEMRWQEYRRSAGELPYGDPRFLLYLFNGPPGRFTLPNGREVARCFARSKELEIWFYDGSERTTRELVVIFQRRGAAAGYEIYLPGDNLRPIQRSGGLPVQDIRLLCADDLLNYALWEISRTSGYDRLLDEVLSPPLPSPEWLANLAVSGTELPAGADTFELRLELAFPARNQSRTAVQALLAVPLDQAPGRRFEGDLYHNFLVTGEVIKEGRLFESFTYRFEGATPPGVSAVPLGFTRYLRPGTVSLRLLVEDVFGGRFAQVTEELEIPSPEGLPAIAGPTAAIAAAAAGLGEGPSLELLSPGSGPFVGMVRFRTRARGEFDRVTFFVDDKPVISKRSPPYSVELSLGDTPAPRRVRVVGLLGDREVATDQLWLNQGAQRFRVRMIEPRPGGIYPGSLTARVEVDTPDGRPPERLELWVNEERIDRLDEPPYARTLRLPGMEVAVVRAVAYLADGTTAEDAVVVNAAGVIEQLEVELVELYALVTDANGEPLAGLDQEAFRVLEDGVPQTLSRFEESPESALTVALLIDRSVSMEPHLEAVVGAAGDFARRLDPERDRLAVLSFADRVAVDVGFTGSAAEAERALAGLVARGGTALYDSLSQALESFAGVVGQSALLLFSDGEDVDSRLTREQATEAALAAGVTIYAVGLEEAFADRASRRVLEELTEETGGRAIFLGGLEELGGVYASILAELRARYLLAYQSTSDKPPGELRSVRVEVDRRGVDVRSRGGYFP